MGLVSFFSDASTEMVYPLIPLYLTATFGATPAMIGVIEGIAESLASILKVFSGYITDRFHKQKAVAFCGYGTTLLYKISLIIASSWGGILLARVIDKIGKGLRTAPRDVLISESGDAKNGGKAFGIHKAMDMAGSAVGILAAFFLINGIGKTTSYKSIFLLSAIPAALGLVAMLFVKEKKAATKAIPKQAFWKEFGNLNSELKLYLFTTFIFTLGNSSNSFLLLRAKDIGFTDANAVLLYFLYNITAAVFAIPFGKLSDKIGRKKLLLLGYAVFAVVYFGFAFAKSNFAIIVIFFAYGLFTAMTSGAERAFIAEISPPNLKGTMLGLHSTLVGIALLPASVIAGFLWDWLGAPAAFLYGAALSCIACVLLSSKKSSNAKHIEKNNAELKH